MWPKRNNVKVKNIKIKERSGKIVKRNSPLRIIINRAFVMLISEAACAIITEFPAEQKIFTTIKSWLCSQLLIEEKNYFCIDNIFFCLRIGFSSLALNVIFASLNSLSNIILYYCVVWSLNFSTNQNLQITVARMTRSI
jgi:hypothetical protein